MKQIFIASLIIVSFNTSAQKPIFKALAFYSTNVERDHVQFANDIVPFYQQLAKEKNFVFDTTTKWSKLNDDTLKNYQLVVWVNEFAQNEEQHCND